MVHRNLHKEYNSDRLKKIREFFFSTIYFNAISISSIIFFCGFFHSGKFPMNYFYIATSYILFAYIMHFILKNNLIHNFENYIGALFISAGFLLKVWMDYELQAVHNSKTSYFLISEFMFTKMFCIFLVRDFKTEVIIDITYKIFIIAHKKLMHSIFDYFETADFIVSTFYWILLSYYLKENNVKLFSMYTESMKNGFIELSKGLDKISENICMISIEENEIMSNEEILDFKFESYLKLTIYQISQKFLKDFFPNETNYHLLNIEDVLSNFIYITKDELEQGLGSLDNNPKHNLYSDILEFLKINLDKSGSKLRTSIKNKGDVSYRTNIFICKTNQGTIRYFEVKYVLYNHKILKNENLYILMLFNDIEHEKYHLKDQQLNIFGNILVSSLTHELNNPLNGLSGQIYILEKANKENVQNHKFIVDAYKNNLKTEDVKKYAKTVGVKSLVLDNTVNEILKGEITKNPIVLILKSLLKNYISSDLTINGYIKFIKYLKKKICLIVENFAIYSRLKLKLMFNIKLNEVNLLFLLHKSLKLLYPMTEINQNRSTVNIDEANFYTVKTDIHIFRTVVSNIMLMFEKNSNKSEISIDLELRNNIQSSKQFLVIKFKLKNALYNKDSKLDSACLDNLDIINIFSTNNKGLAECIGLEYCEYIEGDSNIIIKEIIIKSFVQLKNLKQITQRGVLTIENTINEYCDDLSVRKHKLENNFNEEFNDSPNLLINNDVGNEEDIDDIFSLHTQEFDEKNGIIDKFTPKQGQIPFEKRVRIGSPILTGMQKNVNEMNFNQSSSILILINQEESLVEKIINYSKRKVVVVNGNLKVIEEIENALILLKNNQSVNLIKVLLNEEDIHFLDLFNDLTEINLDNFEVILIIKNDSLNNYFNDDYLHLKFRFNCLSQNSLTNELYSLL